MSLINKTQAEKQADQILSLIKVLHDQLKEFHEQGMCQLWDGEANPQDVLDSLGTNAGEVFWLSGELVKFLNVIDPEYVPKTPPVPFKIEADGTVSITE
jgi:hypothetical protein